MSVAEENNRKLLIQNARAEALSEVIQYENGLLEHCAPNKEIKLICTFRARKEVFDSFVFSPNGKLIALKTAERVYLWDRNKRRSIQVFGHSCFFDTMAFSQDSRLLITADCQKRIHIWDIQTGECVREMEMEDTAKDLRTTADGFLVVRGYRNKVFVWEIKTGNHHFTLEKKTRGFDLTPDGKTIISSCYNSRKNAEGMFIGGWHSLDFWDIESGAYLEERRLDYEHLDLDEIIITPDGKTVIFITDNGTAISSINLKTGLFRQICQTFSKSFNTSERLTGLRIHPHGNLLLTCRDIHSNDLHLWDATTGSCLQIIPGRCESSAFSPDGKEFAAIRRDGSVQIWEIGNGQSHREVKCHADSQTNFALSPNGDVFVTDAGDYALMIWDMRTGKPRSRLTRHREFIEDIAISPDGKTLLSASHDNTIRFWDIDSGQCFSVWRFVRRPLSIAISPDNRWVAVAEGHALEKQWVTIREMRTGQTVHSLARENYDEQSLVFSRDSRSLIIGCSFVAVLWNFESGRVQRIDLHKNPRERSTSLLLYSQDRTTCVTVQGRKNIYGYDLRRGEEVFRVADLPEEISAMAIHPEKQVLISVDDDNQMYEWNLHTGESLRTFKGLPPCWWRWRYIRNLEISADGKLLIAASYDGVISFWDYDSGRFLATSYALDEGYLWTTPPDDFAKNGWLHTDRPDLVSLAAVDPLSGKLEYIPEDDERFKNYMQIHNDGEMVMTRIHDWERYQELLRLRISNKEDVETKMIEARVKNAPDYLPQPKA